MSVNKSIDTCPCCGEHSFTQHKVLWDGLVNEWRLNRAEREYIDKQQGFACDSCGSNLRSMTLAYAIMKCYGFNGIFKDFVKKRKKLAVLEVNEAGHLTQFLRTMPKHKLITYPEVNMEELPFGEGSFDLIVHSDTLEHVNSPIKALTESKRVLKRGGYTCFTTPIVVDRLSKVRSTSSASYHGSPGNEEYLVITEYGADIWTQMMEAGYKECREVSIDYPASVAIIGLNN